MTQSVFEGERSLVLVAGVGAALVLAGSRSTRPLLGGVLVGATVIGGYALATRLFPGRVGAETLAAYRLFRPIGYWNGLGITMVIGTPLAVGFALRGRRLLTSAMAGASVLVLLPTLYFTYSRGSWIALVAGIAAPRPAAGGTRDGAPGARTRAGARDLARFALACIDATGVDVRTGEA